MPSEFDLLIASIEKTGESYVEIHGKLVAYFIRKGFSDSEDLASQTLARVAVHVATGKVTDLKSVTGYSVRVASYIAKEERRKQKRMVSISDPDDPIEIKASDDSMPDSELRKREELSLEKEKATCMRKCFDSLPDEDKRLLSMPVNRAGRNAAEIRAIYRYRERLTEKLRQCYQRCLQSEIQ